MMTMQVPHRPLPRFIERHALLAQVDGQLRRGGPVVLVGAPGAGTTQIAAELARRELSHDRDVFWLNARSEHAIVGDLNVLGHLLHVSRINGLRHAEGALSWLNGAAVQRVSISTDPATDSAAPLQGSPAGKLLVADGATDLAALRRWLPANGQLRIVVTTDDPTLAALPGATAVPVGGLTPDEALTLLDADDDPAGGQAVLDKVGRLPLFVALAATAVRVGRISFAEYLARLRTCATQTGSIETAVVQLAMTALVPDPMSIAGLMARYLALLSPAGTVNSLATGIDLTQYDLRPENQLIDERDQALNTFIEHGLLTMNVHSLSSIMHPVVAAAVRRMYEPGTLAVAVGFAGKMFDTMFERELPEPAALANGHERWMWEHAIDNLDALLAAEVDSDLPAEKYGHIGTRLTSSVMSHRARAVAYLLADGDLARASAQLRLLSAGCDDLLAAERGTS